jgi:hypothetical protein
MLLLDWIGYSCNPYQAVDQANWAEIPCEYAMCRNCDRFGTCYNTNGTKYFVKEYGVIPKSSSVVQDMMVEIFARGPIACYMYAHSASFDNYTGGIINDSTVYPYVTHAVSIVGWGMENGERKALDMAHILLIFTRYLDRYGLLDRAEFVWNQLGLEWLVQDPSRNQLLAD